MAKPSQIDLCLAVLECITPPGHTWEQAELAELCECPRQSIWLIEQRAKTKMANNPQLKAFYSDME